MFRTLRIVDLAVITIVTMVASTGVTAWLGLKDTPAAKAIDVAFVRRDGSIVKIRAAMPAWRMAAAWGGHAVVEMAAGSFASAETRSGDVLVIDAG